MIGAIFTETRPAMIIRSDWRGEPRKTSAPNRAISEREEAMDIISIAQQARPNDMGQIELRRAQFTTLSSDASKIPSSFRKFASWPGDSSVTPFASSIAIVWIDPQPSKLTAWHLPMHFRQHEHFAP